MNPSALRKSLLAATLLGIGVASHASLCETGQRQSPINITGAQRQPLAPLKFEYRAAPLKIANDGHTARVRFSNGSVLRIGNQSYTLQQFHFHTPGGDRIEGEEFPMVVHLLHKSASGQLLALAVLVRVGAENPMLATLLPLVPAKPDGDHLHASVPVDPNMMLPDDRGYFRYSGSLTSAPCTEGVDWIVMKKPLQISADQLATYKQKFADNARAVQSVNRRTILESP